MHHQLIYNRFKSHMARSDREDGVLVILLTVEVEPSSFLEMHYFCAQDVRGAGYRDVARLMSM